MADTIVEKYNSTVEAGNYVSGEQTLFTTDANTTFVIKDITVNDSTYETAPNLLINDTLITSLSTSLTGSELIGASSTVKISSDLDLSDSAMATFGYAKPSVGSNFSLTPKAFVPNSSTTTLTGTTSTPFSTYGYSIVTAWMVNGNYYYYYTDGNSTCYFFKRAGGPGGTETSISQNTYGAVAFDGVRYFYYAYSNAIYRHDTQTGSSAYYSNLYDTMSSYPFMYVCNGFLFSGYSGQRVGITNLTTGSLVASTTDFNLSSANCMWILKDPNSTTYHVYGTTFNQQPTSLTYRTFTFDGVSTATNTVQQTAKTLSTRPYTNSFYARNVLNNSYIVSFGETSGASTARIWDHNMTPMGSIVFPYEFVQSAGTGYGQGFVSFSTPTPEEINEYGPKISLRITGIETA